jgi:hypothetical protein
MGSPTELTISIIGKFRRPTQKDAVRLLARNVAPVFTCDCGKTAECICPAGWWNSTNPYLCEECAETREDERILPVVNSPRMGECGFDGDRDKWTFEPGKFGGK